MGASALASSLLLAPAAFAQTATPTPEQCAADPTLANCPTADSPAVAPTSSTIATQSADGSQDTGEVVVTGSRIRSPNIASPVPIVAIRAEELFQQSGTSIGDVLNDLPQLRSTFAQQNPGAGIGIAGLNLLDLRGLGTQRTLVLVNGRRHVAADILNNASSPDVNTIPADLLERVDIVTGGQSAVYGSDAIAGVVNFVLRRDFDGVQLRGKAGVSGQGFFGNQYVSAMVGKNFAEGRGNITLHGEYNHNERVYASDISFLRRVDGFATVDADSAGLPQGSDGFPDAVFFRDIRSSTTNRFGLVAIPQQAANARCGTGTLANNGPANTSGTPFSCNYIFTQAGNLVAQTGTRFGTGPAGTFVGGNGQTGREGTLLSIYPKTERINTNLLAHYEFSPALEAFVEAKYVRVNAVGNQLGPTFLNNSGGSLGETTRIAPRLDNPFLSAADRATIASAIIASGCGYTAGATLSAASCVPGTAAQLAARNAAVAAGTYRFLFARQLTDLPDRDEIFRRDTYRIVGGFRGTFNGDWTYEVSGNYGKFKERARLQGFVNRQRFLLSLDAGRNPATGQIQCRSQFDATAAVGLSSYTNSAATLASDIAACVPYNPFGAADNSAAAAYFNLPIENHSSIDQLDFSGFVSGDLSQLFELPGGPVRFSIGGEYRREKAKNNSDDAADTGISNAVFLGDVSAKPFKVKEAFGELQIPLLKDIPFFQELTIKGAGRVSDYNSAVGTVYTYNGGVEWAPIRDLRLRGNYGRAVRAPNVSENAFPSVPNFANGFVDPCNVNAIGNSPIRSANCTAQLSAAQLANLPPAGYSIVIISGSNPDLKEEKSDSYTLGGVFTPRFLPGFSFSADYFDITVKNVIVSLSAQQIVDSCYATPNLASPLCGVFQRNLTGTNGPQGELPGQILFGSLVSGPQNFARRVRRGLDTELAYRTNLTDQLNLSTRLLYTHTFESSNFENPALPNFENRILSEVGDPKNEFRWNVDLGLGPITVGYVMRYLGPQLITTYENLNPLNGQDPLNLDAFDITSYGSVTYHDLRFDYQVGGRDSNGFVLSVGVDNLANRKPPLGSTATGAGTAIYNVLGRQFFASVRARF